MADNDDYYTTKIKKIQNSKTKLDDDLNKKVNSKIKYKPQDNIKNRIILPKNGGKSKKSKKSKRKSRKSRKTRKNRKSKRKL